MVFYYFKSYTSKASSGLSMLRWISSKYLVGLFWENPICESHFKTLAQNKVLGFFLSSSSQPINSSPLFLSEIWAASAVGCVFLIYCYTQVAFFSFVGFFNYSISFNFGLLKSDLFSEFKSWAFSAFVLIDWICETLGVRVTSIWYLFDDWCLWWWC